MRNFADLKELTVTIETIPYSLSSGNPFMTMVSIWYALELIPGLLANFLCCSRGFTCLEDHSEGTLFRIFNFKSSNEKSNENS